MNNWYSFLGVSIKNYFFTKKSPKKRLEIRDKRFRKLLKYAYSNSKYYNNLYEGIDLDTVKLEDLPSVNKVDLMANFDDWVTNKEITEKELQKFVSNKNNISKKFKDKYYVYQTSGSTGAPITILEDNFTHNVTLGVGTIRNWPGSLKTLIKFYWQCRFKVKAAVILPFNIFSITSSMAIDAMQHFPKSHKKRVLFIDTNTNLDDIVKQINDLQPDLLASYPTFIKLLSQKQKDGELNIKPKIVTTIGEKLTNESRNDFKETFGGLVCTIYACTEAACITHECLKNHHQHFNEDWLYIEAVDKDGKPVPYGELSDKCYITNLSNFTQPLIRYEITDRIIIHNEPCGCGEETPWIEVEGRSPVLLHFIGDNKKRIDISPISISLVMHECGDNIELYQFILHNNNKIEIRLKVISTHQKEKEFFIIKENLEKFLKQRKINDFEIILSQEEPKFEKSGKFKEIYQID